MGRGFGIAVASDTMGRSSEEVISNIDRTFFCKILKSTQRVWEYKNIQRGAL